MDIELPQYISQQKCNTRGSDIKAPKIIHIATVRDIYKYSFYPRTIVEWNSKPHDIKASTSTCILKTDVQSCLMFKESISSCICL